MKSIRVIFVLLFAGLAGCSQLAPLGTGQSEQHFSGEYVRKVELGYLLYLPEPYKKTEPDSWPLVVFLHGSGERGTDLAKVAVHGPARLVNEGKQFPFILVSPQCPEGVWWNPEDIMALIREIQEKYRVDSTRIYITGLSMGGYGTWDLIARYPGFFAAAVPVCGGGEPKLMRFATETPVWAFHGGKDNVVLPEESKAMVEALTKAGGTANLTLYPEAGHDAWTETYSNQEVYSWLLSHQKGKK